MSLHVKEINAELKQTNKCEPWFWLFADCECLGQINITPVEQWARYFVSLPQPNNFTFSKSEP